MTILEHPGGQPGKWADTGWETQHDAPSSPEPARGGRDIDLLSDPTVCDDTRTSFATAPATRSINTPQGTFAIPARPQRVVCLDLYSAYDLLDVGFTPAGVPQFSVTSILPTYLQAMRQISTVGVYANPDLEKIASLEPDLVVGLAVPFSISAYDKLSGIAPTVLLPWSEPGNWATLSELFADLVGRVRQMAGLKQQYQERCASLAREFAEPLSITKWAIVQGSGDRFWHLYAPDSPIGQILSDIGGQFAAATAGRTGVYQTFINQQISVLGDADVIIVDALSDYTLTRSTQRLLDQPGWKRLKAVKAQRVYPSPAGFPMSYSGALDLLSWLEDILKKFQGVH